MKVRLLVKLMCEYCKVICCKGCVMVICLVNLKYK